MEPKESFFLWNHYHFLLHVIEKFQCAKLQSEQKGLDSRIQISAVICWTNSPNNFITVGTINSVLILMLVLVTCMLCIYLELKIILNLEYFHFPTTNYNIQTKNNLANRKVFNFPNDVLQDSFILGLAIITVIVFWCKNIHTVHKTVCFISHQLLSTSHMHSSPILPALLGVR